VGPFSPMYVRDGLTLDFDETGDPLPVLSLLLRRRRRDVRRQSGPDQRGWNGLPQCGPCTVDVQVGIHLGGRLVYWNDPDGHAWEVLTVTDARQGRAPGRA
jgi:hypothetical protein